MMLNFAAQIIVILLVLGGAIAYIGNYVGKYIGKRRLTIFNLRPRYTATLITVLTGTLIAVSTAAVLLAISQDARTALLGLEQLKREIGLKTQELQAANETLADLEKKLKNSRTESLQLLRTKERLGREIKTTREGQVLFKVGEVISLSLIKGGPEKAKIEEGLNNIIAAAETGVRNSGVKSKGPLIEVTTDEFKQAVYGLLGETKVFVAKLIATRNVLWGEKIPAKLELTENKLIYHSDDVLASHDIAKGLSAVQVEREISRFLSDLNRSAREAGVIPAPSGSLGSVPYSQISELAKKISSTRRDVNLKILAVKDIYSIGPLEVKFKVSNK